MIYKQRIPVILILPLLLAACQPRFEKEITLAELEDHLNFMATDRLKGRYPGTPEDSMLLEYIAGQFDASGLILHDKTGIQEFQVMTDLELGPGNELTFGDRPGQEEIRFMPFPFSASGTLEAEVVFAGYGLQVIEGSSRWNDYENLDVTDKWVMLLRGVPGIPDSSSLVNFSEDRGKALLAQDQGAAGVLLVSGNRHDPNDRLVDLRGRAHPLAMPVVHLSRSAADRFLEEAGYFPVSHYEEACLKEPGSPSFSAGRKLSASVDLAQVSVTTANTLAYLRGSNPASREEFVIIGAHHDHLGMGGTKTSSRAPDTVAVHYGADDNASGVAGVLEVAEYLVTRSPERSFLFTTFGAEEMGLVGSRYMSEHPPVDLEQVQAMINMDMVGRLNEERQLQVGGVGTSPGFTRLLDSVNQRYGFDLKYSREGFGPSDHAAFYGHDIPVLFFSTGAHGDYHTPRDQISALHYQGMKEVLSFVADVAEHLANQDSRLAFTEAGPKVRGSSRGRRGGITFGLMPDVTYDGNQGMPVMFVTEGKPAAVGGVQKGDTITAIEGKSVGNVYDYMNRLNQLKEGMAVIVTVSRAGDELELLLQL